MFISHGWLGEPIGHLLAVDHTLIHIHFPLSLEVGGLLPVICGIKRNFHPWGSVFISRGWLGEPIGHLLAVDHTLIHIHFTLSLEVGAYCQLYAG
ncbi:hypothetical protein JUJ52_01985 [Virgibacillus sp. AGTR]|uniref:hypothetical protein n=1 Tax=Virgibacillus sp. AGTR TaxID=2812055 RepID=UPI001D163552|nr:hypothetical protein [Virgibacillus sp. AGTR]MCC2248729.1 hypothetical protein [Virgibacillus sp. AGTR]